jgi:di/tricarboxylate transporter
LMVMGPGGYRYQDYLRLGLPVAIIAGVVATVGIVMLTGI